MALAGLMGAGAQGGYHQVGRFVLGGEGRWDYLVFDAAGRRLFVSHGSEVLVVGPDSGTILGRIPGTEGVHGVALAPELGRGFTSNGASGTVTVFDLASLRELQRVRTTGDQPDAILYDSVSRRVFTFNGGSDNATAIDAATGRVVGTVPLGGTPEFAVADGRGRVFVNLEDRSSVTSFDARSLTLGPAWPLGSCQTPTGLAMDRAGRRLFAGCRNRIMAVMDANTGSVIASLPIGANVDGAVFDPGAGRAFSSNGDGTLTVVDASGPHPSVIGNVTTERGARTMALDPTTHRIYLVTAAYGPAPEPTAAEPRPRAPTIPGTFALLVYAP
jgi:YVTN family beta-propeller protein